MATLLLLDRGANVEALDYDGLTPLHHAVTNNADVDTVTLLLDRGANVESSRVAICELTNRPRKCPGCGGSWVATHAWLTGACVPPRPPARRRAGAPRGTRTMLLLLGTTALVCFTAEPRGSAALRSSSAKGSKTCPITDYGADVAAANNTGAITRAIADCLHGGTVKVAGGAFRTGPLLVAGGKDVFIEVSSGASLVAAFGPDKWPISDSQSLGGGALSRRDTVMVGGRAALSGSGGDYQDFLVFDSCDGCGLIGEGTLFGKAGRPPVGFDWYYLFDQGKLKHGRPLFLVVNGCKQFTLRGVTLLDAPCFNVALNGVHGAEISHVNITSNWYLDPSSGLVKEPHNTDGIDPGGGSSEIHIHDVYIHNGDDSVAVKPHGESCTRNVLVENCRFEKGHGCSIGSVGKGCVENVLFRNITMKNQENGCRVKTYSDGAGHVTNITWDTITIEDTGSCVTVNANYKPLPKDPKHFIKVSNLNFRNIKGSGCKDSPEFVCPEQSPCQKITLDNVHLNGNKMDCQNAFGAAKDGVEPKSCLKSGP